MLVAQRTCDRASITPKLRVTGIRKEGRGGEAGDGSSPLHDSGGFPTDAASPVRRVQAAEAVEHTARLKLDGAHRVSQIARRSDYLY
jgi:hypothetical protein